MKLKNIMMAAAAIFTLGFVASCDTDYDPTYLSSVKVSSSYVSLEAEGSSATIQVTSSSDWYFELSKADSAWLTVTPASGSGNQEVTFTAAAATATNSTTVLLHCGDEVQRINVLQQCEKVETPVSACSVVNAGTEGVTYRIKGTVTNISSTTYGNMYIDDGTGSVYIYGTLDAAGATKNFSSLGIEVGDIVTVEGPLQIYNGTYELVNVSVVDIEKSLVKCDSLSVSTLPLEGGEVIAYVTTKAGGINVTIPEDAKSWLSVVGITTVGTQAQITFQAAANEGGDRSTTLVFSAESNGKTYSSQVSLSQAGSVVAVTCAQFNALEDGTAQYTIHGVVTKVASTKYGNLYINDGTGEVYVYGVTDWANDTLHVGDEVVLQSVKTSYKGTAQMKNAVVNSQVAHAVKTVAELKALDDDKNTYYYVQGTVCHALESGTKFDLTTYGNFGLGDATDTIYVYGCTDALDGVTKNFAATGVAEGDVITMLAYKTSYKGTIEIVGKFIKKESAAE